MRCFFRNFSKTTKTTLIIKKSERNQAVLAYMKISFIELASEKWYLNYFVKSLWVNELFTKLCECSSSKTIERINKKWVLYLKRHFNISLGGRNKVEGFKKGRGILKLKFWRAEKKIMFNLILIYVGASLWTIHVDGHITFF